MPNERLEGENGHMDKTKKESLYENGYKWRNRKLHHGHSYQGNGKGGGGGKKKSPKNIKKKI